MLSGGALACACFVALVAGVDGFAHGALKRTPVSLQNANYMCDCCGIDPIVDLQREIRVDRRANESDQFSHYM